MKTMKMSKQDTFCRIEIFSVDENHDGAKIMAKMMITRTPRVLSEYC